MLKINKKLILLLLSFLSLILLSSCSYENTTINLGSGFDSTWTFSNSSDYEFDENLVEVVGGKAQLKVLDLEHSGDDFNSGNHVGSYVLNEKISLKAKPGLIVTNVNQILPSKTSDLVGYWDFDSDFVDKSSSGIISEVVGDVSISNSSKVGLGSAVFDGNLDGITLIDYDVFTTEQSGAMWVNLNEVTSQQMLFSQNTAEEFQLQMQGNINNSLVRMRIDLDSGFYTVDSISSLMPNTWYHIAWTYDGSQLRIFINGVLENYTLASGAFLDKNSISAIGARSLSTQFSTNGKIDEVSLWTVALSEDEIFKLYDSQSISYSELSSSWAPKWDTIVSYWKMNGNWQDSSGNGNHGLERETPEYGNGKVSGNSLKVDSAIGVVGDHILVASDPSFHTSAEVSISAWIKPYTFSEQGTIVRNGLGTDLQYAIFAYNNQKLRFQSYDGSFQSIDSNQNLITQRWQHVLIVRKNNNQVSLYIDGKLDRVSTVNPTTGVGGQISIGANAGSTIQDFDGEIDDLAIWNESLTYQDVMTIYNRQKQKYAGHYDSEVMNLGSASSNWPDLSWSTGLPFGKELIGDYDNDGNPDIESSSDYPNLSGDLGNGLVGYWAFSEKIANSVAGNDFEDLSVNSSHANETGGVFFSTSNKFGEGLTFDGTDDSVAVSSSFNESEITVSLWFNSYSTVNLSHIFSYYRDSNCGWGVRVSGGNLFIIDDINGGDDSVYSTPIYENKWYHYAVSILSTGEQKAYLDGLEIGNGVLTDPLNYNWSDCTGANFYIGSRGNNSLYFTGEIDEVAIWNRELSNEEIQQLYRRGANRIKLQVKSCVDSSCNCKSYGAGGSETDCDGDTILNTADTDDIHKSEFIGPGGDGTTYYSEAFNRTNTDVTFNCALNTTDSNAGVCVEDEISFSAGPKPTGPEFLNIDYTQFVTPPANRYAQYRVYMEADENTACSGEPCLPELTSVSLNPTGNPRYSSEYIKVKPKSPITFTKLLSAQIDAEPCATFRLSRSNTEYYFDGTNWVPATTDAHRNPASVVESNITKFANDHGVGELEVNAYLSSDITQSSQCSIDAVDIKFE